MSTSRERMLANIRSSLAQSRDALAGEAARASQPAPEFVHPPQADLVAQFAAELGRLAGYPHVCTSDQEALAEIRSILLQHTATEVIAWDRDQIGLPGLGALLGELGVRVLEGQLAGAGQQRDARLQAL
jgi:L-lactate dehydrogenase complex protein LldG